MLKLGKDITLKQLLLNNQTWSLSGINAKKKSKGKHFENQLEKFLERNKIVIDHRTENDEIDFICVFSDEDCDPFQIEAKHEVNKRFRIGNSKHIQSQSTNIRKEMIKDFLLSYHYNFFNIGDAVSDERFLHVISTLFVVDHKADELSQFYDVKNVQLSKFLVADWLSVYVDGKTLFIPRSSFDDWYAYDSQSNGRKIFKRIKTLEEISCNVTLL